jgi:hypothetical protein
MNEIYKRITEHPNHIKSAKKLVSWNYDKNIKLRDEYNTNPSKCIHCDSVLTFETKLNKFCSRSCSATFNNKKRSKKKDIISDNTELNKKKCITCSSDIVGRSEKYCNIKCQYDYKRLSIFNEIESGNTSISHKWYKKYLIDKHGNECMKCGWSEINPRSNRVPIELEHIDGNSDNNSLDNLELLCPNCHSLTPTYKALNKGNGRYKRRLRYREEQARLK